MRYYFGILAVMLVAIGCSPKVTENNLSPANGFLHGHGLSADATDPNKLYIATHHGLYVLMNEKELFSVGKNQDDFMGFSAHPTDSNVAYSSGHPVRGGNLGVQKSEDGGFTWRKISDGIDGPVDFHSMVISPANPNILFGWYRGIFQVSTDSGKNWKIASQTDFPVVSIAADPKDENKVYAASSLGLFVSNDMGKTWSNLEFNSFVSAVAANPKDSANLLVFSSEKLMKTNDSGKTWKEINSDFNGGTLLYIAFGKDAVYALSEMNQIFKSTDNGESWMRIY